MVVIIAYEVGHRISQLALVCSECLHVMRLKRAVIAHARASDLTIVGQRNQGDDQGVNAVNLRRLIVSSTGIPETTVAAESTIVQTRHRIPEDGLDTEHILILQVPVPEPLRGVERDMRELARMHAEADYSKMWVSLYALLIRHLVCQHFFKHRA